MKHSNALKLVIASLLVAGAVGEMESARAGGYCIPNGGCYVTANPFPGGGAGGGWGGGGWGGGDGFSSGHNDDPRLWCFEFPGTVWEQSQHQCDVYSPPSLEVNGCGTAGGFPVPDYLVSPISAAVALGFGNIFTRACDQHDRCYGASNANKQQCDQALYDDMVVAAQQGIPSALKPVFMPFATSQAWAYSRFLQWEWVAPWTSQSAFDYAQQEARCRSDAAVFRNICSWAISP